MHLGGQQAEEGSKPVLHAGAQPEGYSPLRLFALLFLALLVPFIGPLLTLILGAVHHGQKGSSLLVRSSIVALCLQMLGVAAAVLLAPVFVKWNVPQQLQPQQQQQQEQQETLVSPMLAKDTALALYKAQVQFHSRNGRYGELEELQAAGLFVVYGGEGSLDRSKLGLSLALDNDAQGYQAVVSQGEQLISFSEDSPPPGA